MNELTNEEMKRIFGRPVTNLKLVVVGETMYQPRDGAWWPLEDTIMQIPPPSNDRVRAVPRR